LTLPSAVISYEYNEIKSEFFTSVFVTFHSENWEYSKLYVLRTCSVFTVTGIICLIMNDKIEECVQNKGQHKMETRGLK